MRPLAAHCHLGLGKLFHRTGDRARAAEHLRPQPGCTARWTWASGWRGRRRNSGRPYELTLNRDSRPRSQPRRPKLGSRSYERNSRYERERVQDAFPSLPASRCKTTWLCTTGNSLAGALRSGAGEGRSADRLATTPGQAAGDSRLCHAEPPRGLMGAYAASSGGRTFRGRLSTYRGRAEGRTSPDGPPYPPILAKVLRSVDKCCVAFTALFFKFLQAGQELAINVVCVVCPYNNFSCTTHGPLHVLRLECLEIPSNALSRVSAAIDYPPPVFGCPFPRRCRFGFGVVA